MLADWLNGTQEVRDKARDYPMQWEQFEKWMGGLVSDVKAAKYGSTRIWHGQYFPTAEGSQSGKSFIVTGLCLGILVGYLSGLYPAMYRVWWLRHPGDGFFDAVLSTAWHPFARIFFAGALPLTGAWLGQGIHMLLRDMLSPTPPSGASTSSDSKLASVEYETFTCENCTQRLRVPKLGKELAITCPKCGNKSTRREPS